jgi:hypothetical protein
MNTELVGELPAKAKRWALVVGVDQYQDARIGGLSGAAKDARTLADALTRYAGFPDEQVTLLTTDQPQQGQPTRPNILSRLHNLSSQAPKDGLLLVFFAGHGMARDDGHAYLMPSDAQMSDDIPLLEDTAINVEQMRKYIRATGVRQVIIILDACRTEPVRARDVAPNLLDKAYARAFNFDVRNREVEAFATLYATAVGQRAYEGGAKGQGYFTAALVEGMSGRAANKRGEVTLNALVKYVQEKVPERTRLDVGENSEQKPKVVIEGFRAAELVVAVAGPPPPAAAETRPAPKPSRPPDAADDPGPVGEVELNSVRRERNRREQNSLNINRVLFDCLGSVNSRTGCYMVIYGEGWGGSDVTVMMNGKDITRQLGEQDEGSITLRGNKETLNFISGTNEVIVKVGRNTSETFRFVKKIM